jgi:hypothetical protein
MLEGIVFFAEGLAGFLELSGPERSRRAIEDIWERMTRQA